MRKTVNVGKGRRVKEGKSSDLSRKGVSIWWRVWRMCFCCSCLRILSLLSADFSWISCHDKGGNIVIS
jgi:hypothetical protein